MFDNAVDTLRRFNRSYTPRVGVLDDSFLGTGRPLAAARLLYEIGLGPVTVHELRRRTGADSGYVSRLLRNLEGDGLVEMRADDDDRRRRVAALTADGEAAWNELDQRSDEIARRLLSPLRTDQHGQLVAALD
ncbi:MAG: MarR family winged helix-turn-helix transcriptional regulator, partial [Ilumatobacter sp.]